MAAIASNPVYADFEDNLELFEPIKKAILDWHYGFIMDSAREDWEFSSTELPEENKTEGVLEHGVFAVSKKYGDLALPWIVNLVTSEVRFIQMRPTWQCEDTTVANYVAQFRGNLVFSGVGVERLREYVIGLHS